MVVAHKIRRPKEDSSIWSEFRKFVVLALRSLVHPLQPKSVEAQVHQGSSRSVSGCSVKSHGHLEPHHISYDIRFFALSRRASFHDIISPIELRVFYQGSGPASDFQDSAPPVCTQSTQSFTPPNQANHPPHQSSSPYTSNVQTRIKRLHLEPPTNAPAFDLDPSHQPHSCESIQSDNSFETQYNRVWILNLAENFLTTMPEAEQTSNGDYEVIKEEHTFDAVGYDRYMSWKVGEGHIVMGIRTIKTDTNEVNVILRKGWSVVVTNTEFRLVHNISY